MGVWRLDYWRTMSEPAAKKRTPDSVVVSRYCRARKHHAKDSSGVQLIGGGDALQKLVAFQYVQNGASYDFSHLAVGSTICLACRKEALAFWAERNPMSPSASRSEDVALRVTSPLATESAARTLLDSPRPSDTRFSELDDAHPWAHLSPAAVVDLLQGNAGIANVLADIPPAKMRDFLSGLGTLVDTEVRGWKQQAERAEREARYFQQQLQQSLLAKSGAVLSQVEQELVRLMRVLEGLDPFEKGTWSHAQTEFASDRCANLREALGRLVNLKGARARNVEGGRQSKGVKLRKVCLVLMQLCRLRSERFSLFALKFATYLHFRCVPETMNVLQVQLGLTVDPNTRRKAVDTWREAHSSDRVRQLLCEAPVTLAFVGDNVNLHRGVRDFAAGHRGNQMNVFAVAFFVRLMPLDSLSRVRATMCGFEAHELLLDNSGYGRMKEVLRSALHGALAAGEVKDLPQVAERVSCWPQETMTEWLPINMTPHDSSRPAEVWEMLKSLVDSLGLTNERTWPFYGDMLTCKYVKTASAAYSKDAFRAQSFQPEMGLFHAQMNTIQKVLFTHYQKDLKDAAERLGFTKKLYEPTKNYNVFERVCSGLFVALSLAAYNDVGCNMGALVDRVWAAATRKDISAGAVCCRLLCLLALNSAWKRLVKLADGEGMFDLIRFMLPFLATVKSNMYFPFLVSWVRETVSMSPYDRAMRLSNMFVNRSGEAGHAREVDLEFEYLVCGIKRMAEALPHPNKEQLSRLVQDFPLFEQLRDEVDVAFKPAKHSTSRSVRDNGAAIKQVAAWYRGRVLDGTELPGTKKKMPLVHAMEKFRTDPGAENLVSANDMENLLALALDDYESAFLAD